MGVIMRKLLILVCLIPFTAHAGTAFFIYEIDRGGMTKMCFYEYLGEEYAITIKSYQLCPLTIRV